MHMGIAAAHICMACINDYSARLHLKQSEHLHRPWTVWLNPTRERERERESEREILTAPAFALTTSVPAF